MFQSKRERLLGGMAGLALLVGGGYFFVFRPGYEMYTNLDSEIAAKQNMWEEKKGRFKMSQIYRARFEKMRESLSLVGTEQEKRSQIASELTALLESVSIVATTLQEPQYDQVDERFRVYSYSLRGITTDAETLARLLYAIENSAAVLEVSKLNLKRGSGRTGAPEMMVDLEISRLVEHEIKKPKKKIGH